MGFSAIVCVLSNNFHLQIWIFFSKWTTTTTIFFGSIFLMEITHIESALEMWGYSAESGSISSLKNTNVSSISVPILLHTVSVFYEKKYSQFIRQFWNIIWFPSGAWWDLIFLFSFRPYFHMLRNIGPNHLYVSIPNIRNILRQLLCLKWSIPID